MGNFREFLFIQRKWIVFVVCLLLSLAMMFMGEDSQVSFSRQAASSILSFGQRVFSWAIYLTKLHVDNVYLRSENAKMSLEIQKLRSMKSENDRLRKLAGLGEKIDYPIMLAGVIAWYRNQISNAIVLNRGRKDGVRKNMAVVTSESVVGHVSQVFRSQSTVQLLTDISSRISAVLQNDESVFGIVRWEGQDRSNTLIMENVSLRADVKDGDIVVTSGIGLMYPGNLKIGEVIRVYKDKIGQFKILDIKPYINPENLREVFLILDTEKLSINREDLPVKRTITK